MNKEDVLPILTEIIKEVFDRDDIIVTADTTADDVDEWDSFNQINLIVAAERRFGIKFHAAETEELKNVGEFVALIIKKRGL